VLNQLDNKKGGKMQFRVKELREKRKLTQEELAAKSGVSRALISSLESGERTTTTTSTIEKLADALGVSVKSIFFV
jgi:transcriptional regulator with XRE-family HTH domain